MEVYDVIDPEKEKTKEEKNEEYDAHEEATAIDADNGFDGEDNFDAHDEYMVKHYKIEKTIYENLIPMSFKCDEESVVLRRITGTSAPGKDPSPRRSLRTRVYPRSRNPSANAVYVCGQSGR